MDSFIFYGDYAKQIQSDNLSQISGSSLAILTNLQSVAVEECMSYLRQKYDTAKAFANIVQWTRNSTYYPGMNVYLNAPAYDASATYFLNDLSLQDGIIYQCTTAQTAVPFDTTKWMPLGQQYTIYNAAIPASNFDSGKIYSVGDNVYWNLISYTCLIASQILGHEDLLEINDAGTNPVINIFPDDPVLGAQYWVNTDEIVVPIDTEISDSDYWVPGDTRDQKLVETCVNIILYKAHMRISPRNVPEVREVNYLGQKEDRITSNGRIIYPTYSALGWLQAAAIGTDITPHLSTLQPTQGLTIRYGGNQKLINQY